MAQRAQAKGLKSYHHGDLRNALLAAARQLVDEEGIEGLSLRGVARKALVSRAAPYHHFQDKAGLIAAVVEDCYEKLEESLRTAAAASVALQPMERVVSLGRTYVEFAAEDPARFRLMHRPELSRTDSSAAQGAFLVLREAVAECHQAAVFRHGLIDHNALACWCAVHGVAMLMIDGRLSEGIEAPGMFGEEVARTFCRGLAA